MKHPNRWIAALAATALLLTTAASALAYTGQVLASITVAPSGTVTCTAPFTVAATILDSEGRPMAGESVAWSWVRSPSADDTINATPTITDADGVALTTVALANVTGTREIRATAGDIQASAVIDAACGGLPITSTAPGRESGSAPLAALLVLAVVVAAGGSLVLRRVATRS